MKINLTFLLLMLLLSSCRTPMWPTEKFIKKFNYQEVKGVGEQRAQLQQTCEHMTRYPMYPEGLMGVMKHVRNITVYPEKALNNNITGVVLLSYVVQTDGSVDDIRVLQSVDPLLDNEAIRVLKCMKRWIPGECEGETVRVEFRQPFRFSIK